MFCPNYKNKEVFDGFNEVVKAFGGRPMTEEEFRDSALRNQRTGSDYVAMETAYQLYHKNGGNFLDYTPDGKTSILFQSLLEHFNGDRSLAIQAKSRVYSDAFIAWFGDWINSSIIPISFMPKRGWNIGKIIDNPIDAANICDNTQIKVLNHIIQQFGKPNTRGKFYAKPVTIWAKSPINNLQIHHSTVAVRINGDIYLYDMPQSEYIKYNSENNGTVIKEYSPRLIKYTEENLKNLYGTSNENIHINDESVLDNDIIELPLSNASKVVDENGEPLVVYHGSNNNFTIFDKEKIGSSTDYGVFGKGFYFAVTKSYASNYGKNITACFLNIKNPYDGIEGAEVLNNERYQPINIEDSYNKAYNNAIKRGKSEEDAIKIAERAKQSAINRNIKNEK